MLLLTIQDAVKLLSKELGSSESLGADEYIFGVPALLYTVIDPDDPIIRFPDLISYFTPGIN